MKKNEFERLQPGQTIQHKRNNEWAFIVQQNFGDRLTAVRTIEVRDPENWEVVTEIKTKETEQPLRKYEDVFEGDPLSVHTCGYPRGKHMVDIHNQLICPTTTIEQVAHDLNEILQGNSWYQTVGIGGGCLYIYTTKKKHPKSYTEFGGFPVKYQYLGKIAPLGT